MADQSIPLSNINILDPVKRLSAVPDDVFARLLPDARVEVIRHGTALDIRDVKKSKSPVSVSNSACRSDFFLMQIYDIGAPPAKHDSKGIVGDLLIDALIAKAGMRATYAFREYDKDGNVILNVSQSLTAPLRMARQDWPADEKAALSSIDQSIADGVGLFAGYVAKRRSQSPGR